MDPLLERAAACGIETEYRDGLGSLRKADPEVVLRLLTAIAGERESDPPRRLPRSIVVRGEEQRSVDLAAPVDAPLQWEISSDRIIASGSVSSSRLILPQDLPNGLLRLRIAGRDGTSEEAALIASPPRAYQGVDKQKMCGLAVQLYAVRSARNWGHGEFTDLLDLVDLAAGLGASAVGVNPLHALFDDRPADPSPYFPSSRSFLNPLYIDLDALPEFPGARYAGLDESIARSRRADTVDYAAVADAKQRALRLAYESFRAHGTAERRAAFESFRRARGSALAKFAGFELLRRKFDGPWWEWPAPWRRPDAAALDGLRPSEELELGFFEFVQWLAHEQLDRCRARARDRGLPIGLYLDIAVGVRSDGFDAWCDQDAIVPGMTIGAPPDLLNRSGQDWGLTAFNPVALEDCAFEPYRRMLEASMQYAGAIRLDHVLGLKRLFLVPAGMSAADGLYIRCPFEALLALTVLSSHAARCIVIGEDLGTVPEGFRQTTMDWGLWSYQVMMFERSRTGNFLRSGRYREDALATFATHDLPTFAGWLSGSDLDLRRTLGLAPGETRQQRQAAHDALRRALRLSASEQIDFGSVARFLASAPARLVMISLEDFVQMRYQVNVPGTTDDHPNWRRRLPISLESFADQELVQRVAEGMRVAGRGVVGRR